MLVLFLVRLFAMFSIVNIHLNDIHIFKCIRPSHKQDV